MHFDDVFDDVGEIGVYQWCIFLMISMFSLLGVETVAINFIGGYMEHWCKIPELEKLPHDQQKYVAIPFDEDWIEEREEGDDVEFSECDHFSYNYSAYDPIDFMQWNRSLMVDNTTGLEDCDEWVYDQSEYYSSIMGDWDLVCGKYWQISLSSSIYVFGILCGALACGYMSDRLGRRLTIWISAWVKLGGGLLCVFAPEIITFYFGRFILAMGSTGCYLTGFVLFMEMIGSGWRVALGVTYQLFYSAGYMLIPVVAYYVRDFRKLQLALTLPYIIFLFYYWIVPESPRWLILKERYEEADKLLRYIARVNGRTIREDFDVTKIEKEEAEEIGTCADLMRKPKTRRRTWIQYLHWFTDSLMYYALSFNTGALAGDIYFNTFVAGLVEVPANLFCMLFLNWKVMGRRWTCSLSLIVAGLFSFANVPLLLTQGAGTATTTMSLIGKGFVTIGFSGIYVYSTELFSTDVRQIGMGTCSVSARIGGMIAPFMGPPLMEVWDALPSMTFGIIATLAGVLTIFLPETLGEEMFATVDELEAFNGRKSCCLGGDDDDYTSEDGEEKMGYENKGMNTSDWSTEHANGSTETVDEKNSEQLDRVISTRL